MRRIQFIELHEQPWLPEFLRNQITDTLQFGLNLFKAYTPVIPRLQSLIDATNTSSIVDLCSGGGGPWMDLSRKLRGKAGSIDIWLTDKYPNLGAAQNLGLACDNHVKVFPKPVDAMCVPRELIGLRTMFTSLHHFPPEQARAILQNAVDARAGIGFFEITRRAPATIAFMLVWVFVLCVCTPWIRPFRWSRLFWTYLVPVIPFVLLFDGVVSCLRTYRPHELQKIVEKLDAPGYQWEIDEQSGGKIPITFLIGCPKS